MHDTYAEQSRQITAKSVGYHGILARRFTNARTVGRSCCSVARAEPLAEQMPNTQGPDESSPCAKVDDSTDAQRSSTPDTPSASAASVGTVPPATVREVEWWQVKPMGQISAKTRVFATRPRLATAEEFEESAADVFVGESSKKRRLNETASAPAAEVSSKSPGPTRTLFRSLEDDMDLGSGSPEDKFWTLVWKSFPNRIARDKEKDLVLDLIEQSSLWEPEPYGDPFFVDKNLARLGLKPKPSIGENIIGLIEKKCRLIDDKRLFQWLLVVLDVHSAKREDERARAGCSACVSCLCVCARLCVRARASCLASMTRAAAASQAPNFRYEPSVSCALCRMWPMRKQIPFTRGRKVVPLILVPSPLSRLVRCSMRPSAGRLFGFVLSPRLATVRMRCNSCGS